MSEPSYLSGDAFSRSTASEGSQEVECGECGELAEVTTTEEYSHGETTWYAEWICVCGESNSAEGWYDPNFTDQFVLARQRACLMQYITVATKPINKE